MTSPSPAAPWTCPTCHETGTDRHDLARKCRCLAAPAPAPSLTELGRELLVDLESIRMDAAHATTWTGLRGWFMGPRAVEREDKLRAALSAESERERIRRETAARWLHLPDPYRTQPRDVSAQDISETIAALDKWAKMETSR